uniref:Hemagglutinin-neuraminidase n=1 Tax=Mumps virus genotype K TaxID=1428460 RepID=A0A1P8D435_MUMPV|nr:hemagglutinin-neuraminidase [Mumps virus genotype K]
MEPSKLFTISDNTTFVPGPVINAADKKTFRTCFRILVLSVQAVTLILVIVTLGELVRMINDQGLSNQLSSITDKIRESATMIASAVGVMNQVIHGVTVSLPLQIEGNQNQLLSALATICTSKKQISNCSTNIPLVNDLRFINGINKFIIEDYATHDFSIGHPLNMPSFIPTATSPNGCTRIPSFSLGKTHWCYTHNVINANCKDHTSSNQYVSMGILVQTASGYPMFKTLKIQYLSDGLNRKSCSIATVPDGCAMYCYVSTQLETDDYAGSSPPIQKLTLLFYNDTVTERTISPSGLEGNWATLVPGVGSGIYFENKLIFPAYGGVLPNSTLGVKLAREFFRPFNPYNPCSGPQQDLDQRALRSYFPSYLSNRRVQSAFLVCAWNQILVTNCELVVPSNNQTLMGAEGRVLLINNRLLYYQRSTSWWPYELLYEISFTFTSSGQSSVNMSWIPIYSFTRPGSGNCSGENVCPMTCVSGVYLDPWPLTPYSHQSGINRNFYFTGALLNSSTTRVNPTLYVSALNNLKVLAPYGTQGLSASYTTTTCFQDTGDASVYCVYIMELASNIVGEFQILPVLTRLTIT